MARARSVSWVLLAAAAMVAAGRAPAPQAATGNESATDETRSAHLASLESRWAERMAIPRDTRVVGGVPAAPGEFPWAAALELLSAEGWKQYCGGTLIHPRWVLTAAHCDVHASDRVILGRTDLTTEAGEVHQITEVFNHEGYDPATNDSDLALIKLAADSAQTSVRLASNPALTAPGEEATVIGWGHTAQGSAASDVLRKVDLLFVDHAVCVKNYETCSPPCRKPSVVTDKMICAGEDGKDSCQGDSGGGLLVLDSDDGGETFDYRVAGVVSWGLGCALERYPGVYADVMRFSDWIEETMAESEPAATSGS